MAAQIGVGAITNITGHNQQSKATASAARLQQEQVNAQAAERSDERIREARELRASLRASSAESGVAGNSIVLLGDDMMAQGGRDLALIDKNRRTANEAIKAEAKARIRASRAEAVRGIFGSTSNAVGGYMSGMGGGK